MPDSAGLVSKETATEARARADQYKQALAYLNSCGEMTLEKYQKAHRLTGAGMTEWEVRGLWEASISAFIVTRDIDHARTNLRQNLSKAIEVFEKIAAAGPASNGIAAEPGKPAISPAASPSLPVKTSTETSSKFSFPCPHCSHRVIAPCSAAGKTGKCPKCGQKCKVPAADKVQATSPDSPVRATPVSDASLVERPAQGYRNQLINTNDPAQRLKLGITLCEVVGREGNKEAADALLTCLACDDRGEVSIGLASAVAHLTGPYAKAVRQFILETYADTGDSTFFGGMPLLRLAYVAALQRDVGRLKELAAMRDGDNGTALVKDLLGYVEGGMWYGIYRIMAWGEGLDGSFQTAVLETLPEHFSGKSALIAGTTDAAAYISRNNDYH